MSPETLPNGFDTGSERGADAPAASASERGRNGAQPPYSNRGVYPLGKSGQILSADARFDAYNSTVYEQPTWLIDQLMYVFECVGEKPRIEDGPAVRFYEFNRPILDAYGKRLCSVRFGGQNGTPFVECKGSIAPVVADLLRRKFEHRPARLDASLDVAGDNLFGRYVRLSKRLARKHRMAWRPDGDWITPDAGRTFYLGSRSSESMLRVYEKGLEIAAREGRAPTDAERRLVRCEVEFKPQKSPAKIAARSIEPRDLFALSDALVEFSQGAFGIALERINVRERRESDHDRAFRYACKQYRAHWSQRLEMVGGDLEAFAMAILETADLVTVQRD